ncbi:MAG: hypothetical protein NZ908_03120 [Candidatus Micrarchaeota archaeon]|nr:hypothetical protein [Candidatus Micrarchaeota archaeon]MCX8154346.1 hypothetical protein [Candidatus Micrarchaeota archaeon]
MKILNISAIPEAEVKRLMKAGDYTYNIKLQYLHMEIVDPDDVKYIQQLKEIGISSDEAIAKLIDIKPNNHDLVNDLLVQYGENPENADKIIKIFHK